jgi:hypothetical protein
VFLYFSQERIKTGRNYDSGEMVDNHKFGVSRLIII